MKIKKIILNKFKRFDNLEIDLGETPSKVIALVGPNGCGKSSIFDGMIYLNDDWDQIGTGKKTDDFYAKDLILGNKNWNIEIIFDKGTFSEVKTEKRQEEKPNTVFSFRSSYRYHSWLMLSNISAVPDIKQNNIGAGSSIDLDDKITHNYQRLYSYITNQYKYVLKEKTYTEVRDLTLKELNSFLLNCLQIEITDEGDVANKKGTLMFKKTGEENIFNFNVLSSGEKEVVDILLDLYLKRDEYKDTIYIIDEPELHINPAIQKQLLIEIEKIIPEDCQLWIATHSIGLLSALKEDLNEKSQIISFDYNNFKSGQLLTPMVKNRENWKNIFKIATDELVEIISPKTLIYCEGKKEPGPNNEEQGLDAYIYNCIFSETMVDTLFISSGGNTEPKKYSDIALKILKKGFDKISIFCLKDKDELSDQDRDTAIKEDPLRKILQRRELENYLFDIEILKIYFPAINASEYQKIVTNILQDDVKNKTKNIKDICNKSTLSDIDFKKELAICITQDTNCYKELYNCIFNNE